MGNVAPTVTKNDFPSSVPVGSTNDWVVDAQDADARSVTLTRTITDSAGNPRVVSKSTMVTDILSYGPPTCDDPDVVFVVDPNDPRIVHVTAN